MRYYIVDKNGTIHADGTNRAWAEAMMEDILEKHPAYKDFDLEIVSDSDEEDLAAELREMASFGWDRQEAYDNKDAFIERIGDAKGYFSEKFIFQTWENIWKQIEE